jgi:4-hydroxybenzoate polyprenyltransferase
VSRIGAIAYGLLRPPFAVLLALCAAVGMVEAGRVPTLVEQVAVLVAVAGFMLFAVALNDLADEAVDRVNVADDARRVLVSGLARRRHVIALAIVGAVTALCAAATLGLASRVVMVGGLAFAAAYSLPPFSLSRRGVLTSALLPLGYVAVPYLLGAFSAGAGLGNLRPALLFGLYLGFMGRLALKDFRDERGDRLYGKRTTLVRHGRKRTCLFCGVWWTAGGAVTLVAFTSASVLAAAVVAYVVVVAVLLVDLARDRRGIRDIANIAAIATVGRGFICTAMFELVAPMNAWSAPVGDLLLALSVVASLGMAWECRRALAPAVAPLTEWQRSALPPPAAMLRVSAG